MYPNEVFDDVVADSETDTLTLSASGGISISTDASNDTVNLSYDGVSSVSPLEWTASSSTHSYNNLTITTSSCPLTEIVLNVVTLPPASPIK